MVWSPILISNWRWQPPASMVSATVARMRLSIRPGRSFRLGKTARARWGSPPATSSSPGLLFPHSMTGRGGADNHALHRRGRTGWGIACRLGKHAGRDEFRVQRANRYPQDLIVELAAGRVRGIGGAANEQRVRVEVSRFVLARASGRTILAGGKNDRHERFLVGYRGIRVAHHVCHRCW